MAFPECNKCHRLIFQTHKFHILPSNATFKHLLRQERNLDVLWNLLCIKILKFKECKRSHLDSWSHHFPTNCVNFSSPESRIPPYRDSVGVMKCNQEAFHKVLAFNFCQFPIANMQRHRYSHYKWWKILNYFSNPGCLTVYLKYKVSHQLDGRLAKVISNFWYLCI